MLLLTLLYCVYDKVIHKFEWIYFYSVAMRLSIVYKFLNISLWDVVQKNEYQKDKQNPCEKCTD